MGSGVRAFSGVVLLLAVFLGPLGAQEDRLLQDLGLYGKVASTGNREFPSPRALGIRSTWSFGKHWLFTLALERMKDESQKLGTICRIYAPHISCNQAMTYNEMKMTSLRGGLLRTVVLGRLLRLGFGVGFSFNVLNADSRGDNGWKADLLAPKTGQVGYLSLFSAEFIPLPALPLRLTGGLGSHWVHFHTCSGADPPQYDPFCKMSWFKEAEVGLSLAF
jgi:hypothetical protein